MERVRSVPRWLVLAGLLLPSVAFAAAVQSGVCPLSWCPISACGR
jgi:hypothetical protein